MPFITRGAVTLQDGIRDLGAETRPAHPVEEMERQVLKVYQPFLEELARQIPARSWSNNRLCALGSIMAIVSRSAVAWRSPLAHGTLLKVRNPVIIVLPIR